MERGWRGKIQALTLHSSDRERIIFTERDEADFHFYQQPVYYRRSAPGLPMFHSVQAYGSVIAHIIAPNSDAYRDYYRAGCADVEANGTLLARSAFDIYAHNDALYYISANYPPPLANADVKVFLHVFPVDAADLSAASRERGFENLDFLTAGPVYFFMYGGVFDGKCVARRPLPDYPIARVRTGQSAAGGGAEWRVDIDLTAHTAAQATYEGILAGDYGQTVAQSDFDVYLRGNDLAYLKENCVAGDVEERFFLHIFPVDSADLPADWRERGFDNLDFQFADHGAYAGDKCVAMRELPGYAIDRIRTGQFVSGEGRVWGAEFAVGR